jgi:hypothetical protein
MTTKPILFSTSTELWESISGYEGRYEVSSFGNVKSLDGRHKSHFGKIMKPWEGNHKYLYVDLRKDDGTKKTYAIHRLVLEAFVEKKPDGKQCAHYDGNPQNNYAENLRWATAKENIDDRKRHGRTACGENSGAAKLDDKCVKTILKLKNTGFASCEVAHLACVTPITIQRIWNGEIWRCVVNEN